jgi:hypothetical protein
VKATTTVARWTWGRDHESGSSVTACLQELFAAHAVLSKHRLMVGTPRGFVSVHEAGKKNRYLFQGEFQPEVTWPPSDAAKAVAEGVEAAMSPGELGSIYADIDGVGDVVVGDGVQQEPGLFRLGASTLLGYISVELVTRTDFWLPYDLKGRPQPEVYAANGPRLSAALRDLSEVLDADTDPDDPTYFAKPNETGAENFFDEDGKAQDVWGSFEVPTRYDVFTHAPGFGRIGYRRTADGEVTCVPVRGEGGRLLGHLWASDPENAASFEPEDVGEDVTYHAGLVWLERLRAAHDRGLSPSAALAELSTMAHESDAGQAKPSESRTTPLAALRESAAGPRCAP